MARKKELGRRHGRRSYASGPMLNADDVQTITSLSLLRDVIASGSKPLVIWLGAGTSRWAGYPSWEDCARCLRTDFFRTYKAVFDNDRAVGLIDSGNLPEMFQLCRDVDAARYNCDLTDIFGPKSLQPPYKTFINRLSQLSSKFIVTTNVDEALERRLPECAVVQQSDLSRVVSLVQSGRSFVAKLHGTISAIDSVTFTLADYARLEKNESYNNLLRWLFTTTSVIFLGYGVRDEYVLKLLSSNYRDLSLFGTGPHFVVSTSTATPPLLHRISYHISLHPDHRAAMTVLDYIEQVEQSRHLAEVTSPWPPVREVGAASDPPSKTVYYITDVLPPGINQTPTNDNRRERRRRRNRRVSGIGFHGWRNPCKYLDRHARHSCRLNVLR